MRYQQLKSSWLEGAAYEPRIQILTVRCMDGRVYRSFRVPPEVYEALLKSDSPGQYYTRHVTHGGYRTDSVMVQTCRSCASRAGRSDNPKAGAISQRGSRRSKADRKQRPSDPYSFAAYCQRATAAHDSGE